MQAVRKASRLICYWPRAGYYQRLYRKSKARETIFKENIEVRKLYDSKALPLYRRLMTKTRENKNKLALFLACCSLLQLDWVYTCRSAIYDPFIIRILKVGAI